ncbi:MAG: hypothetical protein HXY40_13590 [Chloroflexi bacterium]|nr:hypothetical protein [Chloroflexota bacterium]
MNPELYKTIRELMICAEIMIQFEPLEGRQYETVREIHHWASFLSNLCENISKLEQSDPTPYYRTMDAPFRRILNYVDALLSNSGDGINQNQWYSFQRIRRLTLCARELAQSVVAALPGAVDESTAQGG